MRRLPARAAGAHHAAPEAARAAATPVLEFDRVSLDYATERGRVRATEGVSLEVRHSERYVLLGPSGSGKSTLLKAAGGFIVPREGAIRLDGETVTGPGPDRMVVFQEFDQLLPWKSVFANVLFPMLASRSVATQEAESRARDVLQQVGLLEFADALPHQLSGGMKQRVAIARALAMRPRVLLMDEPFASLDALTRRQMQAELLSLWESIGFTLLFVTHSIEESLLVGTRIGVLSPHPGRLRAEINAHEFDARSEGSAAFQNATRRVHDLLFEPVAP